MRTCTLPGCNRKHFARGLCKNDYRRAQRAGRVTRHPTTQIRQPVQADGRRVCGLDGCDLPHFAHGLCRPHGARLKRTGDVQAGVPVRTKHMPFGYYNTPPRPKRSPRSTPARLTLDLIDTEEL